MRALTPEIESLFTLGQADGDEWESFGDISGVAFAPDGGLYVLDGLAGGVTHIGPTGRFLEVLGGRGAGPGEFTAPVAIAIMPDGSLVVNDLGRGFHVFDAEGDFIRLVAVSLEGGDPGPELWPLDGGRVVAQRRPRVGAGNVGQRPLIAYSLADGSSTTLREAVASPTTALRGPAPGPDGGSGPSLVASRVFAPTLRVAVTPDGSVIETRGVGYDVAVYDEAGSELARFGRNVRPLQVTEARRRAEIAHRVERRSAELERLGPSSPVDVDAARDMMARFAEQLEFAEEIPVVTRIRVDSASRVWVELYGDDVGAPGPTDIYTLEGEYLGTIPPGSLPAPIAFGPDDRLVFLDTDSLGVQHLEVARFELPRE